MWPDGNHAGGWADPTAFVIGLVLIAALFVAAVALIVAVVGVTDEASEDK